MASKQDYLPNNVPLREGYGYEIIAPFRMPLEGIILTPGQQGLVISIPTTSNNRYGNAEINIPELRINTWVPTTILRGGFVSHANRTYEFPPQNEPSKEYWLREDVSVKPEGSKGLTGAQRVKIAAFRSLKRFEATYIRYANDNIKFVGFDLPFVARGRNEGQPLCRIGARYFDDKLENYESSDEELDDEELSDDGLKVDYIQSGASVEVEHELRLDGKPHFAPFCCLTLDGPYHDWQRAMSWAVKIRWTDIEGNEREHYVQQRKEFLQYKKSAYTELLLSYHLGMAMVRWLLGEVPNEHAEKERYHSFLEGIQVFEIKTDWLSAKVTFVEPLKAQTRFSSAMVENKKEFKEMSDLRWRSNRTPITHNLMKVFHEDAPAEWISIPGLRY